LLTALAAFLLVPSTPVLQSIAPISETAILLLPTLATCMVLGWQGGGRGWLAGLWGATAIASLVLLPSSHAALGALETGWAMIAAAAFGLVCTVSGPGTRFFPRALTALVATVALAASLAALTPGAMSTVSRAVRDDIRARPNAALVWFREVEQSPEWRGWTAQASNGPAIDEAVAAAEGVLAEIPRQTVWLFPALLALESLAAYALGWAVYHRISRTRLGEPLGRLRDFRFNDQLVWGVIAGAVFLLLPAPGVWRGLGLNLLIFFGTLYALRGLGVLVWFLDATRASAPAVVALAIAAGLLSAPVAVALGLLGLGDSWLDWRRRWDPATPRQAT
jgi:Predicted membrane protein (DUF2232)